LPGPLLRQQLLLPRLRLLNPGRLLA
jgi:hypothetical protein